MRNLNSLNRIIFVDPPSKDYYSDRLFDINNPVLNRDKTLEPFFRLRGNLLQQGTAIRTADYLQDMEKYSKVSKEYYSLGFLGNYKGVISAGECRMQAFVLFEPPVVAPHLYRALPELTAVFERVYVHNVNGDGYSLEGVNINKLRKLYWPLPYNDVLESLWNKKERARHIVVINGNHNPRFRAKELYSKRIEVMVDLARLDVVDLFGYGWNRWWSPKSMWLPYWRNRATLMSIYRGSCPSKFDVLSGYKFCLCFENMSMDGYITEKLFDCLSVGTIPLYLGAQDVKQFIPESVYIDCRQYRSWKEMWDHINGLSERELESMRNAGRAFLRSDAGRRYYHSLEEIFEV
ncbi:MAG: glycosyltransferase family 10 [Candidatus Manganitrophus sp. SA1]|nr:glycosyltransferase family 10 [Candidatus Manganitrophus morganii]